MAERGIARAWAEEAREARATMARENMIVMIVVTKVERVVYEQVVQGQEYALKRV